MKVIGAGLPRTATTTQLVALEQLGFAPCYHMRDLLGNQDGQLPLWERVVEGDPDWEAIFKDAKASCDFPPPATTASFSRSIPTPRFCSACARPPDGSTACARPSGRCISATR